MEILLFLVVSMALYLIYKSHQSAAFKVTMPDYEVHHYLLTPEGISIYNKINNIIAEDECCYIKVSAAACLRPVSSTDEVQYLRLSHAIANKYFDLLICEKHSLQPRLAILINQKNEPNEKHNLLNIHQADKVSHDDVKSHHHHNHRHHDNRHNQLKSDDHTMSHAIFTVEQIQMLKQSCDEAGLPCIFMSLDALSNPQTLQDTIAPYVNSYA